MEIDSPAHIAVVGSLAASVHDRFGQPLADIFLALHTSGLQMIDA